MDYSVLFDLKRDGPQDSDNFLAAIFLCVGGILLLRKSRDTHERDPQRAFTGGILLLAMSLALPGSVLYDYCVLRNDHDSRMSTVAGVIQDFASTADGTRETFTVNGIRFEYGIKDFTSSYHCPSSKGGQLQGGMNVRIGYTSDRKSSRVSILRIETTDHFNRSWRCDPA